MQQLWDLNKKSAPIIGTRLVSAVKGVVLTLVVSKKAPQLLSQLTLPLALTESAYYSWSMLFTQGTYIVGQRVVNDDTSIAEYYFSGIILGGVVAPVISTGVFLIPAFALGLSDDVKIFIGLSSLSLAMREMNMHTRAVMVGVKKKIGALDGAHISLITTLLEAGGFFGLSWWLIPESELVGVFIATTGSSAFKLLLDSMYLVHSKKVFRMPDRSRVWEEMKERVKEGGLVSLQTLLELLVFLWGLPLLAHWSGPTSSAALQIALSAENLTNPLSGGFSRGMMRQMDEQSDNPQKMKACAHRALFTTVVVSLLPLSFFLAIPREIASIFTQDKNILDVAEGTIRLVAAGQALYNVRAVQEVAVRTLPPNDTKFAFGVSIVSAAIFFALAVPLTLEESMGFTGATAIFAGVMGLGLGFMAPRYLASTTDIKCLKRIGIFKDTSPEQMPLIARQDSINDGPK